MLAILPNVHQNEQLLYCWARYNATGTEYEHESKKGLNNCLKRDKRNLKCFILEADHQLLFIQTSLLTPTPSPLDFPIKGTYLMQPTVLRDHVVNATLLAQIAFKQSPLLFFYDASAAAILQPLEKGNNNTHYCGTKRVHKLISAAQEITGNKLLTPAETKHVAPAKNFGLHVEWTAVPDTKNQGLETYTSIRKCYSFPYSDNLYGFKPSVCL